jgi:hypothetical protein
MLPQTPDQLLPKSPYRLSLSENDRIIMKMPPVQGGSSMVSSEELKTGCEKFSI